MPCGRVHARWSVQLALPCFALGWLLGREVGAGLACAGGCLLGVFLTPDLDQESISTSEYWLIKYTMGLGFLWTMLWYPYARACKHRGFASHFPLVSTLLRLAYLGLFLALAAYCGLKLPAVPGKQLAFFVVGLVVSDTCHWALDTIHGDPGGHWKHSHARVHAFHDHPPRHGRHERATRDAPEARAGSERHGEAPRGRDAHGRDSHDRADAASSPPRPFDPPDRPAGKEGPPERRRRKRAASS